MKFRVIEWQGELYIVVGLGYDEYSDPPDVFYAVPLEYSLIRSLLVSSYTVIIPISEAIEITDQNRIKAIWILYGSQV